MTVEGPLLARYEHPRPCRRPRCRRVPRLVPNALGPSGPARLRAHDAGARRVRSRNDAEASPPVRTRQCFRTQLARRLPGCLGRHRGPRRCHGRSRRASAVVPGRDAPGGSTAVRSLGDPQRGHAGRPVLARCRVRQSVHGERRSPATATTRAMRRETPRRHLRQRAAHSRLPHLRPAAPLSRHAPPRRPRGRTCGGGTFGRPSVRRGSARCTSPRRRFRSARLRPVCGAATQGAPGTAGRRFAPGSSLEGPGTRGELDRLAGRRVVQAVSLHREPTPAGPVFTAEPVAVGEGA